MADQPRRKPPSKAPRRRRRWIRLLLVPLVVILAVGVLAVKLERRYSKDRILEMYLNQIYFGHGAFGVEAAARTFFGKSVSELTPIECVLLAGLPKAPSTYSPFDHSEASLRRRSVVLA